MAPRNLHNIVVDDFTGGQNSSDSMRHVAPNQHAKLVNLLIDGGELKPIWGREKVSTDGTLVNGSLINGSFDAVYDWSVRYEGTQYTHRIAIWHQYIFIDTGDGVFLPMYCATSDPTTGFTHNVKWTGSIVEMNDMLYITGFGRKVPAPGAPDSSDDEYGAAPIVWHGYVDYSRKASTHPNSPQHVTFDGQIDLRPGDKICLTVDNYHSTVVRTIISLPSESLPDYYLLDATLGTQVSDAPCVASRIHHAGMLPMSETTGQEGIVPELVSGSGLSADSIYQYKFAWANNERQISGNASELAESRVYTWTGRDTPSHWSESSGVYTYDPGSWMDNEPLISDCVVPVGRTVMVAFDIDVTDWEIMGPGYIEVWVGTNRIYYGTKVTSVRATGVAAGSGVVYIKPVRITDTIISNLTVTPSGSSAIVTTTGNQSVKININLTTPEDLNAEPYGMYHADRLQIWRTLGQGAGEENTSPYYLVTELVRDQPWYKFPSSYVDTTSDEDLATHQQWSSVDNEHHDPPPALMYMGTWNDHLWGIDKFNRKALVMSSLFLPEYWPTLDVDDFEETDPGNTGTVWRVGTESDPVTAICPEVGAYSTQGRAGATLLVFTKSKAMRITGRNKADLKIDDAFSSGCLSWHGPQNCDGIIVWPSRSGVMAVEAGEKLPVLISAGIRDEIASYGAAGGETPWDDCRSAYWQGYYIATMPDETGAMNPWLCYISRHDNVGGSRFGWVQADGMLNAKWFHVSGGAPSSPERGGHGDLIYADADSPATIWRTAPWLYTTDPSAARAPISICYRKCIGELSRDADAEPMVGLWVLRRVSFIVQTDATENIECALRIWDLGYRPTDLPDQEPEFATSQILECDGTTWNNAPRVMSYVVERVLRWPLIELRADLVSDFRIMAMHLQYSWHGETQTDSPVTSPPPPLSGRYIRQCPEYPNAVFWDGSGWQTGYGNTGTMTATFDTTAKRNAYVWTSSESTVQYYYLIAKVRVPYGWRSWNNCRFYAYASGDAEVALTNIFDTNNTAMTFTPVTKTAGAWSWVTFDVPSGTFDAGGLMTLVFRFGAANGDDAMLSDLEMDAW